MSSNVVWNSSATGNWSARSAKLVSMNEATAHAQLVIRDADAVRGRERVVSELDLRRHALAVGGHQQQRLRVL
jgi:hypothetical protein